MRTLILAAAFLLGACAEQPVYRTVDTPFTTAPIALDAYLGLWHEQARLPASSRAAPAPPRTMPSAKTGSFRW